MRIARLIVMVGLILAAAAPARAAGLGWWGYLERLSGPGPFQPFVGVDIPVKCYPKDSDQDSRCIFDSGYRLGRKLVLRLEGGISKKGEIVFADPADTRRVKAFVAEVLYVWRPVKLIDVGAGAGWMTLWSGAQAPFEDFAKGTPTIPVLFVIAPFRYLPDSVKVLRGFQFELGWKIIPEKLTASDFGELRPPPAVADRTAGREAVFNWRLAYSF